MESNSVCNHTSDQQNRTTAQRESDLSITSMITDWIGRHDVLLPINQNYGKIRETNKSSIERWTILKRRYECWKTQQFTQQSAEFYCKCVYVVLLNPGPLRIPALQLIGLPWLNKVVLPCLVLSCHLSSRKMTRAVQLQG